MYRLEKITSYFFYAWLFLLPWQTRWIISQPYLNGDPWQYGEVSLYGTQIFLWVILFLFFFILVGKVKTKKKLALKTFFKLPAGPYWLMVLFVLWAGVSVAWAFDKTVALQGWLWLSQSAAVIALLLNLRFSLIYIASALAASAVTQSMFALWQFGLQYVPAQKWLGLAEHLPSVGGSIILQTETERWMRAYGSLPHPNILGGFLVLGFIALFYLACRNIKTWQRGTVYACGAIMSAGLFVTFSRSAWLALIAVVVWMMIWVWRGNHTAWKNTMVRLLAVMITVFGIYSFVYSDLLFSRIAADNYLETASISFRYLYVEQASELIAKQPVWGWGIHNYTLAVYQHIDSHLPSFLYQPVHVLYLLIFTELGAVGLLIFLSLIAFLIYVSLKNAATLERTVSSLFLLALLLIGLFDHYMWSLYIGQLLLWLAVGLLIKYSISLGKVDKS